MIHRQNNVLLTESDGAPGFAPSYSVHVLPVGATAVSFLTNTATVDAGHGFAAGDKVLIWDGSASPGTAVFEPEALDSVTATTLVWSSATPTIASGNLLCNLGPDTSATSTPNYDAIPGKIYTDAAGNEASANNLIYCDTVGNYDYYTAGDGRCWELIRNTAATPAVVGVVPGWGGVSGRYNIADYGAAVDGSTNDHLRATAAILAANAVGGGTVFFPEGDTEFGGTATLLSNVNLAGSGRGSKISTSTGTDNLFKGTSVSGVNISDLFMEGGSSNLTTNSTGLAVWTITTCSEIVVEGCHFEKFNTVWHDSKGDNLGLHRCTGSENATAFCRWLGTTDSVVSDNRFSGARSVGDAANTANFVWFSAESGPVYTARCTVANNNLDNFLYESILLKSTHCAVTGNTIDSNGASSYAINMESGSSEAAQPVEGGTYNTVVGNTITSPASGGIRVGNNAGTNTVSGHHNVISGNIIATPGVDGITLAVDAWENTVSDNYITDAVGHGISMGSTAYRNTISGNYVVNSGTATGSKRGVLIQGGHGHLIRGNYIYKTDTHGIYMNGTNTDVSIIGNVVVDAGATNATVDQHGIVDASTSTNTYIANNKCWSQDGVHQKYGISIASSATAPMVVGNDCRGNTSSTNGMNITGAAVPDAIVMHNHDANTSMSAVAAAATTTLPPDADAISVTGATGITSITASYVGRRVTLVFASNPVVTDGSNLKLAGNFSTVAGDTLTLICDGTNWQEVARSVVSS